MGTVQSAELKVSQSKAEYEASRTPNEVNNISGFDNICALQSLPTELVWTIFEYAHESVSELRLVRFFSLLSYFFSNSINYRPLVG